MKFTFQIRVRTMVYVIITMRVLCVILTVTIRYDPVCQNDIKKCCKGRW